MADRLVNKILHQPIRALREVAPNEPSGGILRAALRLFGLGRNPPEADKEGDTTGDFLLVCPAERRSGAAATTGPPGSARTSW